MHKLIALHVPNIDGLTRHETKVVLGSLGNSDQALSILNTYLSDLPGMQIYRFENTSLSRFLPTAHTAQPFLIQNNAQRQWLLEQNAKNHPAPPPGPECTLCVAYRKKYTRDKGTRTYVLYLDKAHHTVVPGHQGSLENQQEKMSFLLNYKPYFKQHFVAIPRDRDGSHHDPWRVDIEALLLVASQFSRHVVGQNSGASASVPRHRHLHVFQFDGLFPIETRPARPLTNVRLGGTTIQVDRCEYPLPVYRFRISKEDGISAQAMHFIQTFVSRFARHCTDHEQSAFCRNSPDSLDLYLTLTQESPEGQARFKEKEVEISFKNGIGILSTRTDAATRKWQTSTDQQIAELFQHIAPDDAVISQLEALLTAQNF